MTANESKMMTPNERFHAGRGLALSMTPDKLQLDPQFFPGDTFGVIMESDFGGYTVSTVAYLTGDASIYGEKGPVLIGGASVPGIPEKAKEWVEATARMLPHFEPADSPAVPPAESTVFYALTKHGLRASPVLLTDDVMRTSFRELFTIGHELFRLYRLAADEKIRKENAGTALP